MAAFRTTALALAIAVLLSGCVTSKLLEMGKDDPTPKTLQPLIYMDAERQGSVVRLLYDSMVDADGGVTYAGGTKAYPVDLATLSWQKAGKSPLHPGCTAAAWRDVAPAETQRVPLIQRSPSDEVKDAVDTHARHATGAPPLSVQSVGLDAWIVCGAEAAVGYAKAPTPPAPSGGGRKAEYVVGIIVLLPFALALDVVGVTLCVASVFLTKGGTCK